MKRRDFIKGAAAGGAVAATGSKAHAQSRFDSRDQIDLDNHAKIQQVIGLAMKGAAEGNRPYLSQAFHDKAQMFGEVNGTRYDEPIKSFAQSIPWAKAVAIVSASSPPS